MRLFDGQHHNVDSSEMAFKIAGSMAFKQAVAEADAYLLEPIMQMTISVPEDAVGDVIGDLNSRRGRPLGMEPKGTATEIKAEVPMAEVLDYAPDLRAITGGRGDYTMEFLRYEEVPGHIAQKVVAEAKADDASGRRLAALRSCRSGVVVNVDGGARGNPGPAAIAAVVATPDGEVVERSGEAIGERDQQRRRVPGAAARDRARSGARARAEVELIGDSELVVKQVRGEYRVKDAGLRPLHAEVRAALAGVRALVDPPRAAASRTPPPTRSSTRRSTEDDPPMSEDASAGSAGPIDPGVEIGHVHLKVADLDRALGFYCGVLGFEVRQRFGGEAAFVAAGDYHHHIGLNTWQSKGGSPPPAGTTGLFHTAILYPTRRALADALQRRARRRDRARRRLRPRRQRGDLPARPRPERARAVLGPAPRAVAPTGGRLARRRHVHRSARPRRPALRARDLARVADAARLARL